MSILAIDWGRKRIGMAYTTVNSAVIFPLGSLDNNTDLLYNIAHIVVQYKITEIVVGYPSQMSFVSKSIDGFIKDLGFVIDPSIIIHRENEDYSSIEAGAILGEFTKTAAEDTLAAGIILGKFMSKKK